MAKKFLLALLLAAMVGGAAFAQENDMNKKERTPEDYAALEERWAKTPPEVDFSKPGVFARQRILLESLDTVSAVYIQSRAEASRKTPAQIIGDMVRERIAATA